MVTCLYLYCIEAASYQVAQQQISFDQPCETNPSAENNKQQSLSLEALCQAAKSELQIITNEKSASTVAVDVVVDAVNTSQVEHVCSDTSVLPVQGHSLLHVDTSKLFSALTSTW